jgi:hypothetical protein
MKHKKEHGNARSAGLQRLSVCFESADATAFTVCIAETLSQWQPKSKTRRSAVVSHWLNTEHGKYEQTQTRSQS